jgi:hypothetical protein
MRLWHMVSAVAFLALVLTLFRDPISRVFLIVFTTGLGEVVLGLLAVMTLFETIGAIGEAKGLAEHAEALAATSVVLCVAWAVMGGWLFVGCYFVYIFT